MRAPILPNIIKIKKGDRDEKNTISFVLVTLLLSGTATGLAYGSAHPFSSHMSAQSDALVVDLVTRLKKRTVDFSKESLANAYFSHLDLDGVFFQGANLTSAHFDRANLAGAKLSGAILERASLNFANLQNTDLRRANMTGADLSNAALRGANFEETIVTGANFASVKGLDRVQNLDKAIGLGTVRNLPAAYQHLVPKAPHAAASGSLSPATSAPAVQPTPSPLRAPTPSSDTAAQSSSSSSATPPLHQLRQHLYHTDATTPMNTCPTMKKPHG